MNKKVICCVHDKKSDTFEGFFIYNNPSEAIRSFEMTCQKNETFQKWPEDFQFVQVGHIFYENGEIKEDGEIKKEGNIEKLSLAITLLAEAKDYIKKNENTPK